MYKLIAGQVVDFMCLCLAQGTDLTIASIRADLQGSCLPNDGHIPPGTWSPLPDGEYDATGFHEDNFPLGFPLDEFCEGGKPRCLVHDEVLYVYCPDSEMSFTFRFNATTSA